MGVDVSGRDDTPVGDRGIGGKGFVE